MQHKQHSKTRDIIPDESVFQLPHTALLGEKHWDYIQKRYYMSPREIQVARLVCQGLTNDDVAGKLKVRPGTVKTHLRSIFGKTRARNKITMLLIFVDDVSEFFGKSPVTPASVPIVDGENSAQNTSHPWQNS